MVDADRGRLGGGAVAIVAAAVAVAILATAGHAIAFVRAAPVRWRVVGFFAVVVVVVLVVRVMVVVVVRVMVGIVRGIIMTMITVISSSGRRGG